MGLPCHASTCSKIRRRCLPGQPGQTSANYAMQARPCCQPAPQLCIPHSHPTPLARPRRELRISSCSDIFHGRSFAELAGLQQLRVLAVTCNTAQLSSADLAPLERLRQLQVPWGLGRGPGTEAGC